MRIISRQSFLLSRASSNQPQRPPLELEFIILGEFLRVDRCYRLAYDTDDGCVIRAMSVIRKLCIRGPGSLVGGGFHAVNAFQAISVGVLKSVFNEGYG